MIKDKRSEHVLPLRCVLLFVLVILFGCQGGPIRNEFPAVRTGITTPSDTAGIGKVVFVNDVVKLFSGFPMNSKVLDRDINKALGSGFVDIYVGGKGLKKLDVGEYAQVLLPYGVHEVEVDHTDIMGPRSKHSLEVSRPWTLVVVYPRAFRNSFEVVDSPVSGTLDALVEAK